MAGMLVVSHLAYLGWLPPTGLAWPLADKVLHFLLFGAAAFWLELWLGGRAWRVRRSRWPLALIAPVAAASLDELAQWFSPGRTPDLADWACGAAGALVFWLLARRLAREA